MIFTSEAAAKVAKLIEAESNTNINFRIIVEGGGCSGFRYSFIFDETIAEDDTVIETNGIKLLVDPISFQYLSESTIDFEDNGLMGSKFVINNPGVRSTCGCGQSFSA